MSHEFGPKSSFWAPDFLLVEVSLFSLFSLSHLSFFSLPLPLPCLFKGSFLLGGPKILHPSQLSSEFVMESVSSSSIGDGSSPSSSSSSLPSSSPFLSSSISALKNWILYEEFASKCIRECVNSKTTFLEDVPILSPFVLHQQLFQLTRIPQDRLIKVLHEKAKVIDTLPPMDLAVSDPSVNPEKISMEQLRTLEKLRFSFIVSDHAQGMRSYVLSLYLSHLQKSVGEYNGEKHYTSMLTPTERRVHQKEKKLYENRDPFRPGEDITSFESSGSPPKKGFGYLDRPPFPIYIYAPVFVSHFRTLQTDVGEQKTPFALQMLCTVALHSLLQLGGHSSPVPEDLLEGMISLTQDPSVPLLLIADGVDSLPRSEQGYFFDSIARFAKVPNFISEPPGIASPFMHDNLHVIVRQPPLIANSTRLIVGCSVESVLTARQIERVDFRDWPFLELKSLNLIDSQRFARGVARSMGISTKKYLDRIEHSLSSTYSPYQGHLLLLHLFVWHEARHERQEGAIDKEFSEAKDLDTSDNYGLDREAFQVPLMDFVNSPPSFLDDEPYGSNEFSPPEEETLKENVTNCCGVDDVYKDVLLCWIRKWWDAGKEKRDGESNAPSDDIVKWLIRLCSLFGYLNHWIEDCYLYLTEKLFIRSIEEIYSILDCTSPIMYAHNRMKSVIRVLGPISPLLQTRLRETCNIEICSICQKQGVSGGEVGDDEDEESLGCCYMQAVLQILESLTKCLPDRIDFFHSSFREYLTALFLADEHVSLPIRDKLSPNSSETLETEQIDGPLMATLGKSSSEPSENALAVHKFLNPNSSVSTSPNAAVVQSVEYTPPVPPHFHWHLAHFHCSPFWRPVYVFAANAVPFGFLFVGSQLLKPFAKSIDSPPSEGLCRSFGAIYSHSYLPLMWGENSDPSTFTSPFMNRTTAPTEGDKNRLISISVAAEHCYRKEANPVWEYVNNFGGKKGKSSLVDMNDSSFSRLVLLLQLLGGGVVSACRQQARHLSFNCNVGDTLSELGEDITRFFIQVSGETFKLESAKIWEAEKETFFSVETKLWTEFRDATLQLFMKVLSKDPEVVCLLRGETQVLSSLPPDALAAIMQTLLDPFRRDSSADSSPIDPVLAVYHLARIPTAKLFHDLELSLDSESKGTKTATSKTTSNWRSILSSGGGVTKHEPGGPRDLLSVVAAFVRLVSLVLKNEGQKSFPSNDFRGFMDKIIKFLKKYTSDAVSQGVEAVNLITHIFEESHNFFSSVATTAYAEYESCVLGPPVISLSHPLLCPVVVEDRQHRRQRERRFLRREGEEEKEFGGEKAEVKGEAKPVPLSQEGNGMLVKGEELELMNDLLPKEYFLDVVRFAKFRLYQPFHDVLIAPGSLVGSVNVLTSQMLSDREAEFWSSFIENLLSPDPLVQMATFFFAGDPHSYIRGCGDGAQSPSLVPPPVERESKMKRSSSQVQGATSVGNVASQSSNSLASSRRSKSGQMPLLAAIRDFTSSPNGPNPPLFRPLHLWGQKRDTTPILVSLLNWLLCPLAVTRAYVDTVKGIGGKGGREKSEETLLQERIQIMQQRQSTKTKKSKKGRKGSGSKDKVNLGSESASPEEKKEKKEEWTSCVLDRIYNSLDWFLGRLFGPAAVLSLSSLSFSSKVLNNCILRQVLRQVILELSPLITAQQFGLFVSLPLPRDYIREAFVELEHLFQSPPLKRGPMQSGSAVEAWLAELLFLLLHEKLPVGVQDSLLSSLTSILWQVPKKHLGSVVRQFLRAVRSVMPRPVEEGEPLQHYSISSGHRMLFEVTVLAFDSVACGVEPKHLAPRVKHRANLILQEALKEPECYEALIAIAQAASSDPTTPPYCVASLSMLLYLAGATNVSVFSLLLARLFESSCPKSRQKCLYILGRLPSSHTLHLLNIVLPIATAPLPNQCTTDTNTRQAIGIRAAALTAVSSLVSVHPDSVLPALKHLCFPDEKESSSEDLSEVQLPNLTLTPQMRHVLIRSLLDVPAHVWALSMKPHYSFFLNSALPDDVLVGLDIIHEIAIWVTRYFNKSSRIAYRGNLWAVNDGKGTGITKPQEEGGNCWAVVEPLVEILEPLVPLILSHLSHDCMGCRSSSFRCLSTLGPIPRVFSSDQTRNAMLELLENRDDSVIEMVLRVLGTCVGGLTPPFSSSLSPENAKKMEITEDGSDVGATFSLQLDRKVLELVIRASDRTNLVIRKASVKLFASVLATARRLSRRNAILPFEEEDSESTSVVVLVRQALCRLMHSKEPAINLQVMKVLCEIPLEDAAQFVNEVRHLCTAAHAYPTVKSKGIYYFARIGIVKETLITSIVHSVINFKEPEVIGDCVSTMSAIGCFAALYIPSIMHKLKKKSEAQIRRKLAILLLRFDQEHKLKNHTCTLTKIHPPFPETSSFAINFEKAWKGDMSDVKGDIESARDSLPLNSAHLAVEASRLNGWGLFRTEQVQVLESMLHDEDYIIRRTVVRILGQCSHVYLPVLRKIIQYAFYDLNVQIKGFAQDIIATVGSRRPYLIPEIMTRCALLEVTNPETNGKGRLRVWQRLTSQWRRRLPHHGKESQKKIN